MSGNKPQKEDERLPLRWAVILFVALGAGIGAGFLLGPVVGWGTGLGTATALYKIVGK